jgi:hypothetical protein
MIINLLVAKGKEDERSFQMFPMTKWNVLTRLWFCSSFDERIKEGTAKPFLTLYHATPLIITRKIIQEHPKVQSDAQSDCAVRL